MTVFYQKPFICILTSAHIIPSFHPSSTSIPLCYLRHIQTSNHIGMSPHLQITPQSFAQSDDRLELYAALPHRLSLGSFIPAWCCWTNSAKGLTAMVLKCAKCLKYICVCVCWCVMLYHIKLCIILHYITLHYILLGIWCLKISCAPMFGEYWGMVKASVHSQGCPLQTTDTPKRTAACKITVLLRVKGRKECLQHPSNLA